ncbi:MAG: NAD-dependent epimerase/dehydratase family protein [Candidatus Micrarchaeaceae archaeon]
MEEYEMTKGLVTGGSGFIGSYTVDLLINEGYDATVSDNNERKVRANGIPRYVNQNAKYIDRHIRFTKHWSKALNCCKYVIHLAISVGVSQRFWQSRKYMSVSTLSTASLYDVLIHNKSVSKKIKKIVVASSKSIYGEGSHKSETHGEVFPHPRDIDQLVKKVWDVQCPISRNKVSPVGIKEEKPPQNLSPYALSKYDSERIAVDYSSLPSRLTFAFRYFNAYGPRQTMSNPYTGIMSIFLSRLKNKKPLIVFEDGKQLGDFIYVEDIATFNVKVLERGKRVFNLGIGRTTSLLGIIQMLSSLTGSNVSPKIIGEYRVGDIRHDYAAISNLESTFGSYAFTPLNTVLDELVKWSANEIAMDKVDKTEIERKKYLATDGIKEQIKGFK